MYPTYACMQTVDLGGYGSMTVIQDRRFHGSLSSTPSDVCNNYILQFKKCKELLEKSNISLSIRILILVHTLITDFKVMIIF